MQYLRQSTANQVVEFGPFVDSEDGNTPETSLTIANTDIRLLKHGSTAEVAASAGGTHLASGRFYTLLGSTDSDTIGRLTLSCHVSGALAVKKELTVLSAAVYDSLFGTTAISTYAGGAVQSVTNPVTVGTNNDKTGYSLSSTDVNIVSVAGNSVTSTDDFKADVSSIPTSTLEADERTKLLSLVNTDLTATNSAIAAIPTSTLESDERSKLMSLVNTDLTATNNAIAQIPTDNDVNIVSVNGVSVVSVDDFKATTVIASNMVSPAPSVSDIQQAAGDALTAYDAAKGTDSMNLSSTAIEAVRNDLERSGGVLEVISTSQIDTTDVETAATNALTTYDVAKVSDIPSGSSNDPPVVSIDTSGSPWEMVYYDPSDGVSEIARRSLYTVDGIPITSTNQIVGQQMKV